MYFYINIDILCNVKSLRSLWYHVMYSIITTTLTYHFRYIIYNTTYSHPFLLINIYITVLINILK